MNFLKTSIILLIVINFSVSCKKDPSIPINVAPEVVLEGGEGGAYYFAIFPEYKNKGIKSKVSIRFAANKFPVDSIFSSTTETMIELGYGPHVHYSALKKGSYYIFGISSDKKYQGDTVIVITDSTAKNVDYKFQLKDK